MHSAALSPQPATPGLNLACPWLAVGRGGSGRKHAWLGRYQTPRKQGSSEEAWLKHSWQSAGLTLLRLQPISFRLIVGLRLDSRRARILLCRRLHRRGGQSRRLLPAQQILRQARVHAKAGRLEVLAVLLADGAVAQGPVQHHLQRQRAQALQGLQAPRSGRGPEGGAYLAQGCGCTSLAGLWCWRAFLKRDLAPAGRLPPLRLAMRPAERLLGRRASQEGHRRWGRPQII